MEVFNDTSSSTVAEEPQSLAHFQNVLLGVVLGLTALGVCGNYLSFRSAWFLPEATSKYLMRYLAIWDTLSAVEFTITRNFSHRVLSTSLNKLKVPLFL